MVSRGWIAILWICAAGPALAQQPQSTAAGPVIVDTQADQPQSSDQPANAQGSPLDPRNPQNVTPDSERERQIRMMNPLDPSNPMAPDEKPSDPRKSNKDENQDKDKKDRSKASRADEQPLPGSIAASEQQGPAIVDPDQEASSGGYNGPAVLSRSYTINRPMIDQNIKWGETAGFGLAWDSGLTGTTLTPQGTVASSGPLVGTTFLFGFNGRHVWTQDQLAVSVNGNYSQYVPSANQYSGLNATATVNYGHLFSRRLSLNVVANSTVFSQNYNLESSIANPAVSPADINISSSPAIQIFDTTTRQFSLQTGVTWQKSSRLSFSAGGSYFGIDRTPAVLIGVTGYGANGDVQYRWSYRATVGAYYSFSYYQYPHNLNVTDSHTGGLTYSYAFSRSLQLRLRGGMSRIESLGLQTIPLSPLVAALLGQTTDVIDAYTHTRTSDISGQLIKDFRNGKTGSLFFVKGLSPGNGVLQSSEQESYGASGGMHIFRRYAINMSASRDSLSSISQTIAKYSSESVTIGISRQYRHDIGLGLTLSYRYFNIGDAAPVRNEVRIASNVSWDSGGRLWPF